MFANVTLSLMGGFVTTVQLFCLTLVFALPLGLLISFGSMSRITPLRALIKIIVWIVRGTPLMLQIIIIYYGPALVWGIKLPRFSAALLSFVINYACYFSEIFRGGIQSISQGQFRAGLSLGMTYGQTMRYIVLPQAFKRIIPPLGNEFIAMLKDSSLVSVIGFEELTRSGQLIIAETYGTLEIWTCVAIIYLTLTLTISRFVAALEKRFRKSDDR